MSIDHGYTLFLLVGLLALVPKFIERKTGSNDCSLMMLGCCFLSTFGLSSTYLNDEYDAWHRTSQRI